MRVKICGLKRPEDIAMANAFRPDYIGFVFAKSKRRVSRELAVSLRAELSKDIQVVGVFVDEDVNLVAELANQGVIDLIQLHGTEDQEYIRKLRKKTKAEIIQAVRLEGEGEINIHSEADYVLLDSGAGSGETFDWSREILCDKPIFLAGGLTPENVAQAIFRVQPMAVDVSSGVESDGCKDIRKVRAFIEACRKEVK